MSDEHSQFVVDECVLWGLEQVLVVNDLPRSAIGTVLHLAVRDHLLEHPDQR